MARVMGAMVALILALSVNAKGAEFSYQQDPIMGCFFALKGEIRKGDAKRFEIFSKYAKEKFNSSTSFGFSAGLNSNFRIKKRICLESPGGSLSEAIKIARLIYGDWGTAVGRDQTCESACSIIFMAGSVYPDSDERITIVQRILHPLGRLGFHAPSLRVAEGEYSADTVSNAYDIALKGFGEIYKIAGYIKFPPTLIGQMIATPPSEMFYIETIGQAARWYITIAPSVDVEKIGDLAIINACSNHHLYKSENIPLSGEYRPSNGVYYNAPTPEIKIERGGIYATMAGFGDEAASKCRVTIENFEISAPPPSN